MKSMKTIKLCICLCTLLGFNSLFAQKQADYAFLFPQFEKGFVVFKNGTRTPALLNYSTFNQEMMFLDDENQMMEFANLPAIHSVIIGDRRFFPVSSKRSFCEEINTENGSFYIQYNAYMISKGKETAYGGYSQTTSASAVGSIEINQSRRVMLESGEKFGMKRDEFYFIKTGNSFKRFYSAKTLGKLFKGYAPMIDAFAKEKSIDFTNYDDIVTIVDYAYSLMKE
jgi:hypothetical protein